MDTDLVVSGRLAREYILPPAGAPILDAPGGSGLYACGGALAWKSKVGLLAHAGEDYPRQWLKDMRTHGVDTTGVTILERNIDLRAFHAYDSSFEATISSPVAQFARRQLTFPKALLGYQPASEEADYPRDPDGPAPLATEIPAAYRDARAVHLCPMDFTSHHQLASTLKSGAVATITVDPAAAYMHPGVLSQLRVLLADITAFVPSEEDIRSLYWGQTYDLWEMLEALGEYGCDVIVAKRGAAGQAVYDARGKHRWEIPAYPARLADPTGAGDTYCGGFLAGYQMTYDPLEAALRANVSASLGVEGSGPYYPQSVTHGLAHARLDALRDLAREM